MQSFLEGKRSVSYNRFLALDTRLSRNGESTYLFCPRDQVRKPGPLVQFRTFISDTPNCSVITLYCTSSCPVGLGYTQGSDVMRESGGPTVIAEDLDRGQCRDREGAEAMQDGSTIDRARVGSRGLRDNRIVSGQRHPVDELLPRRPIVPNERVAVGAHLGTRSASQDHAGWVHA